MYENSRLIIDSSNTPEPGGFTWRSPSNIAIVKYWGKYGAQMPRNPSLSLTLAASCTDTRLDFEFREEAPNGQIDLEFFFHQEENDAFRSKVLDYLNSLLPVYPFLKQLKLTIHTGNSFPHSAGIASSASSRRPGYLASTRARIALMTSCVSRRFSLLVPSRSIR